MEMISFPITIPKGMTPFLEGDRESEFKWNAMILYPDLCSIFHADDESFHENRFYSRNEC